MMAPTCPTRTLIGQIPWLLAVRMSAWHPRLGFFSRSISTREQTQTVSQGPNLALVLCHFSLP